MDSYDNLPDAEIKDLGEISRKFLELKITSFKEACLYVHDTTYGYNSNYDDKLIFFKEKMGSCTMKHATIAGLAEELSIPLYKYIGVYKFTEEITTGVNEILNKHYVPYIPMVHCFLVYKNYRFDLTEGNYNGKKKNIEKFIDIKKVDSFISRTDEYKIFKKILKEKIMVSKEMKGISERNILKAREAGIKLLKECIKI